MLGALDLYLSGGQEIGVIGLADDDATTNAFFREISKSYLPNKILGYQHLHSPGKPVAFLVDRPAVNGQPTVYVCENFTCKPPVTTPEALAKLLQE